MLGIKCMIFKMNVKYYVRGQVQQVIQFCYGFQALQNKNNNHKLENGIFPPTYMSPQKN